MAPHDADTHWLTEERILAYSKTFILLAVVAAITWCLLSKDMVDWQGRPFGFDYIAFWAASHLALTGHAADAYDPRLLWPAMQLAVPATQSVYGWFYPPPHFLVILPVALLPYPMSYLAFMAVTLSGYLIALRGIIRGTTAMWCLAAFPGLLINLAQGQNGFVTAALAGGALLCLPRRPALAGILIGLLVIKPHLALLFPVALLAIGAWRAIFWAALTVIAVAVLSVAILGEATLQAFLASLEVTREAYQGYYFSLVKMPSALAGLRLLGTPIGLATALHGVVAVGAALVVWRLWRRCRDWPLRSAALVAATFLATPYSWDSDLAWLAFPIAWLAVDGLRWGWLRGDREILLAAWILPIVLASFAELTAVQIGPFVLGALLWMIWRRAALPIDRGTDLVAMIA